MAENGGQPHKIFLVGDNVKRVKIFVDTSADMPKELAEKYDN